MFFTCADTVCFIHCVFPSVSQMCIALKLHTNQHSAAAALAGSAGRVGCDHGTGSVSLRKTELLLKMLVLACTGGKKGIYLPSELKVQEG